MTMKHGSTRHAFIRNARFVALFVITATAAACSDTATAPRDFAAMFVPAAAIEFDYVKVESGPGTFNWFGNVSGGINGALETRVVGFWQSGPILHIQTEWIVGGSTPFQASLDGTLDSRTGKLNLIGVVTSGWLAGARMHNSGQLTGIDATTGGTVFEGSAKLMPGSAR